MVPTSSSEVRRLSPDDASIARGPPPRRGPEGFAADQLREVAPDLESHFSETQRQPQRDGKRDGVADGVQGRVLE